MKGKAKIILSNNKTTNYIYLVWCNIVSRRNGRWRTVSNGWNTQFVDVNHMGGLGVHHKVPSVLKSILALNTQQGSRSLFIQRRFCIIQGIKTFQINFQICYFSAGLQPDKRLWSSKSRKFIHWAAYCATPETFSSKLLHFNLLTPSQFHIQLQARFNVALFIFRGKNAKTDQLKLTCFGCFAFARKT